MKKFEFCISRIATREDTALVIVEAKNKRQARALLDEANWDSFNWDVDHPDSSETFTDHQVHNVVELK